MTAPRLLCRLLGYVPPFVPLGVVVVLVLYFSSQVLRHMPMPAHSLLPVVSTLCHTLPVATDTIRPDTPYCVTDQSGATMVILVDRPAALFPPMLKVVLTPGPSPTPVPGMAAMPTANGNFTGSGMGGPP